MKTKKQKAKTRATECSKRSNCQLIYIFFFLSVLSEFDKSYRRLRTNFYFLYFSKQKCQGMWSLDPPSGWKCVQQMIENNCRWKGCVCQFIFHSIIISRLGSWTEVGGRKQRLTATLALSPRRNLSNAQVAGNSFRRRARDESSTACKSEPLSAGDVSTQPAKTDSPDFKN